MKGEEDTVGPELNCFSEGSHKGVCEKARHAQQTYVPLDITCHMAVYVNFSLLFS